MKMKIRRGYELIGLQWEVSGILKEQHWLMSAFVTLTLVLLEFTDACSFRNQSTKWKKILKSPNTVKQQKPVEHLSFLSLQVVKKYKFDNEAEVYFNGLREFGQWNGAQISQQPSVISKLEWKCGSSNQSADVLEVPEQNGEKRGSWSCLYFIKYIGSRLNLPSHLLWCFCFACYITLNCKLMLTIIPTKQQLLKVHP